MIFKNKRSILLIILSLFLSVTIIFILFSKSIQTKLIGNFNYYTSINKLPFINLLIDDDNFASLNGQLKELQKIQWEDLPYTGKKIKFDGHLIYKKIKHNVQGKIVGIYSDHWKTEKPSIKFYLKNNKKTIFNLNGFSLLNPKTRDYLGDWIASEFEKEFNLLNLKRDFVLFSTNYNAKKVYLSEESFDGFSKRNNKNGITFSYSIFNDTVSIKIYNESYDPKLKINLQNSLTEFIASPNENNSIFDLKKMAKYYIITDIVQGFHQLVEFNTHLFYNYDNKKIEAIGREWNSSHRKDKNKILSIDFVKDSTNNISLLHRKMFEHANFKKEYLNELNKVLDFSINNFFKTRKSKIDLYNHCLWKDTGKLKYDFNYIYENMNFISNILQKN